MNKDQRSTYQRLQTNAMQMHYLVQCKLCSQPRVLHLGTEEIVRINCHSHVDSCRLPIIDRASVHRLLKAENPRDNDDIMRVVFAQQPTAS